MHDVGWSCYCHQKNLNLEHLLKAKSDPNVFTDPPVARDTVPAFHAWGFSVFVCDMMLYPLVSSQLAVQLVLLQVARAGEGQNTTTPKCNPTALNG